MNPHINPRRSRASRADKHKSPWASAPHCDTPKARASFARLQPRKK